MVENRAISTENIYAEGTGTVRVYRIYEAAITDLFLIDAILEHSDDSSHQSLCDLAIADARSGGRGKANSVLALPWERLRSFYRAMSPAARNVPIMFEENRLDSTVAALLDEIAVPRYQSVYSSRECTICALSLSKRVLSALRQAQGTYARRLRKPYAGPFVVSRHRWNRATSLTTTPWVCNVIIFA